MIFSLLINKEITLKINLNNLKNKLSVKILKLSNKLKQELNKMFNNFLDIMMS